MGCDTTRFSLIILSVVQLIFICSIHLFRGLGFQSQSLVNNILRLPACPRPRAWDQRVRPFRPLRPLSRWEAMIGSHLCNAMQCDAILSDCVVNMEKTDEGNRIRDVR